MEENLTVELEIEKVSMTESSLVFSRTTASSPGVPKKIIWIQNFGYFEIQRD